MSDYTYDEMFRMQNEAKKRVMEMQKRSKAVARSFNSEHQDSKDEKTAEPPQELPRVPKAISYPAELHSVHSKPSGAARNAKAVPVITDIRKLFGNIFGDFSEDDYEKMLILSLCLLLTKENGDDSLILALMYLLT